MDLTPVQFTRFTRKVVTSNEPDVAARYGVSSSSVSHIVNRKAWRHVDVPDA